MKKLIMGLLPLLGLFACNNGGSTASISTSTYPQNPTNTLPDGFLCLPSGYPAPTSAAGAMKIAYGRNCQVTNVTDTPVKETLESMAVALTDSSGGRYCTGTPLSYDSSTGVAYVLSAAHCVVGNPKTANQQITANNIVTFSSNKNYINQTLNAAPDSGTTGTITAVYVPKQYCEVPEFSFDGDYYGCSALSAQNGDLALVKVNVGNNQTLAINPQVQLATSAIQPTTPSYIMALGYGMTNVAPNYNSNTSLYYITYEYFATNSYQGESGELALMNGYSPFGFNAYYNIICGGDSGGGDFYWANNKWNLIGVHSYGTSECGASGIVYSRANDVSADVRPFASQLSNIMDMDQDVGGCNGDAANNNNFVCADASSSNLNFR